MNHEGRFFKYEFRRTGSPLGEGTFKPNSIPSISAFVPETRYRHPQLAACGLLPIPNSQQPKANGQRPTANGQKPTAKSQKPKTLGLALAKLRQFIDERQIIAGVKSEKDLESAGNIYRMNVATRPRLDGAPAYPQIPETDKKNGVAHEGGNPHRPKDSRNGWDEDQE